MVEIGADRISEEQRPGGVVDLGRAKHVAIGELLEELHHRIAFEDGIVAREARLEVGDDRRQAILEGQRAQHRRRGEARQVDG